MLLTEYNEVETMELFKEEGKAEEHINTMRESKRADDAEAERDIAVAKLDNATAEIAKMSAEMDILKAELEALKKA